MKLDPEIITALNAWRLRQSPVLDPNAAILALLRKALTDEGLFGAQTKEMPAADPALEALIASFKRIDRDARPASKAAE